MEYACVGVTTKTGRRLPARSLTSDRTTFSAAAPAFRAATQRRRPAADADEQSCVVARRGRPDLQARSIYHETRVAAKQLIELLQETQVATLTLASAARTAQASNAAARCRQPSACVTPLVIVVQAPRCLGGQRR